MYMLIAIDGYEANVRVRVGIGRYAYEIISHLYRLRTKMPDGPEFVIHLPSAPLEDMPQTTSWWKYHVTPVSTLWTLIGLPWALTFTKPSPDAVFSPTHYSPRWIRQPRVVSIMDVSYLEFGGLFRRRDLYKLVNWTRYSAKNAKKIFTISINSRNAIIKAYSINPEKVIVTYPGMSDLQMDDLSKTDIFKKYKITGDYILSVGTVQPRKNYQKLISAFAGLLKGNALGKERLSLIIIGKMGWLYEDILAFPQKLGIADQVRFLDFVPDTDLKFFYRHAVCYVQPSLYEGFGLPVAEAMRESCPVVVSRTSSLPEVAGPAGIYVDPDSADDIARGIIQAVNQRTLPAGEKRIAAGLEHIKKFTWENAARQTMEILTGLGKRQ